VRNGILVTAAFGTPVRVIHEGTVAFADSFTGFGNLVIVDHGNLGFTMYGHLSAIEAPVGRRVVRGQVVGSVGSTIDGTPALYFELRIDGKPVDPLQWLKKR
jgi:septal ring factor EnvC (AmiA/AmiB activator)